MHEKGNHRDCPEQEPIIPRRFNTVDLLRCINEAIAFATTHLMGISLIGQSFRKDVGKGLRLHCIPSSYVSDTPEAEDLLGVKRGIRTDRPFH